jgi:hypothetical protein
MVVYPDLVPWNGLEISRLLQRRRSEAIAVSKLVRPCGNHGGCHPSSHRLTLETSFNSPMQAEKSIKTRATLHIPIHHVLQRALEWRWEEGWAEFMGRAPAEGDLIVPRQDGKQRLVSGT